MEILYWELSKETERGREEKSKSTDLSNRSLKIDGRQRTEHLHRDLLKDREGLERKRARSEI